MNTIDAHGGDMAGGFGSDDGFEERKPATELPPDLPTSLNDRRPIEFVPETEMYDAWQGA